MSQSHLIAIYVPLGQRVRVMLVSGGTLEGRLAAAGEGHVLLVGDDGRTASVTDGLLGGFETLDASPAPATAANVNGNGATPPLALASASSAAPAPVAGRVPPPDLPAPVREALDRVVERFDTALSRTPLAVPGLVLELPPVPSEWSDESTQILRRAWQIMGDKYRYAVKVGEPARFAGILRELQTTHRRIPLLGPLEYNLGWFALEVGHPEAFGHLLLAAHLGHGDAFVRMAAADLAARRHIAAHWALGRLLRAKPTEAQRKGAWHPFLQLTLALRSVAPLEQLILETPADRLLADTVAYVVHRAGERDADRSGGLLADVLAAPSVTSAMLLEALREGTSGYAPLPHHQQAIESETRELERRLEDAAHDRETDRVLDHAERLAEEGSPREALRQLSIALARDPASIRGLSLRARIRARSGGEDAEDRRPSPSSHPNGQNPYARAKRAEHTDRDVAAQERYLREAIAAGDSVESAVKDFAMLLDRTGRTAEGIALLERHQDRVTNPLAFANIRSQLLASNGRHAEAIDELHKVRELETPARRPSVDIRIAELHIVAGRYDDAAQTLRTVIDREPNEKARMLLGTLQRARETETYDELDALIASSGLVGQGSTTGLSPLLEFHLQNCSYAGVEAATTAAGTFSERDVAQLERRAKGAITRPRERAGYNLSAARIDRDLGREMFPRFRDSLRGFTAGMGDAAIAEHKSLDAARAYYVETISLSGAWDNLVGAKLAQIALSFYSERTKLLEGRLPSIESCIASVKDDPTRLQNVVEAMLIVALLNVGIGERLVKQLSQESVACGAVMHACQRFLGDDEELPNERQRLPSVWGRASRTMLKCLGELDREFKYLRDVAHDFGSLQQQADGLEDVRRRVRLPVGDARRLILNQLEVNRLGRLQEALVLIARYVQQGQYLERERLAARIATELDDFASEIEDQPTRFSFESLRPYVNTLRTTVAAHFREVQEASLPTGLRVELTIDSYVPDAQGGIEVEATVQNGVSHDRSPASRVRVSIVPSDSQDYVAPQAELLVTESLTGGDTAPVRIPLRVSEGALAADVFTLRFTVTYFDRQGHERTSGDLSLPISLYDRASFKPVTNPYNKWAHGTAVTDKSMFYGRERLIASLVEAVQHGSARSLVIHGQKRAGKSSVLHHLKARLEPPLIPVSLSAAQIGVLGTQTPGGVLYMVCQAIALRLADVSPVLCPPLPALSEVTENPFVLYDYLSSVRRMLDGDAFPEGARLVLLIDEFTKVYASIKRGHLDDGFMSMWKALLEREFFTSVLVGQDVMQQFIEEFPNEFQVSKPRRVSYLDLESAEALITEPIRIPDTGESRFRGTAVRRIYELTAGSPYYIQIFCDRLVEYMNIKSAVYVADGHVEDVARDLVQGPDSLRKDTFDNLVYPGERDIDSFPEDDTMTVLGICARQTRNRQWLERSSLRNATPSGEDLVDDLISREVLEQSGPRLRIHVGLFKQWLLANGVGA
ncbi:nSTAND1 domain-containing NTPase [Baekduia sp. Peel2402]|uniref:nSTAND1 domain-containing NTPase n=1 Tax=Baekduia sp. Peel2402 TaxID=3458296 RepID=UPI00403E9DD7